MKITEVKVIIVQRPPLTGMPPLYIKGIGLTETENLVLQIHTDQGLYGEVGCIGNPRGLGHYLARLVRPYLIDKTLDHREALWRGLFDMDRMWNGPVHLVGSVDVALWDLYGKSVGRSISNLLGSYRDKLPVYASSLTHSRREDYIEEALRYKDRGWPAYKLHPLGEVTADIKLCTAVREAVGDDYGLMLDPVAAYNHIEALKVGRAIEELGFTWYEEPLRDYDIHGYRMLADKLEIPILAGEVMEGFLFTLPEYIATRAIDIARADVSYKGGVSQVYKMAAVAEAFGLGVEVHSNAYQQLDATNLHLAACIKNTTYFERMVPEEMWEWGVEEPIHIDNEGFAHVPTGPGIGINIDQDWLRHHTVAEL